MEANPKEVLEYVAPNGKIPFRDWLNSLRDQKAQVIVDARITNVIRGTLGDSRSVGKGVKELKIAYGPGYRIYFGEDGSKIVLLLCAGTKKTQERDIRKAHEYWEDYRRRK